MTRQEARNAFVEAGLNYSVISKSSMALLRRMIDAEMRASGLIGDSYRAGRAATIRHIPCGLTADIRCQAYYFTQRQAVTFEPDGFIGFAGWADDDNVQPILKAFVQWVDEMKTAALAA